jgi:hypothetical protein
MKFYEFLKHLTHYGPAEATEAGDAFFDEDEADDGDEPEEIYEEADEAEDVEPEDEDADELDDDEDGEDEYEPEEDDYFDDDEEETPDDDEEEAESEDDPESEGEGGEDGGAVANALRQAIRARLTAEKASAGKGDDDGVVVNMPTVADLKAIPGLEEVHEDDLTMIHGVAAAIVKEAISSFNETAVAPMRSKQTEERRKAKLVNGLRAFNEKYPGALEKHQDNMAVVWDEFEGEFGRDLADTISFEDLYIMAGGKGKAAANKKAKGVAKKLATDQKKKAVKSSRQAGSVAKVRAGGKRKRSPNQDVIRETERHIRKTNFTPFTIR